VVREATVLPEGSRKVEPASEDSKESSALKFRRKSTTEDHAEIAEATEAATSAESGAEPESEPVAAGPRGPYDADGMPADAPEVTRIDLGSLQVPAVEGLELRLQVDEASGQIAAVLLTGEEGAIELRAFAAPRNADLWAEVLPQLAADVQQRGGQVGQRDGNFGPELICQLTVTMPDGQEGVQPSRILGINGPRWLLRVTFLGRPAVEQEVGEAWEGVLHHIVVSRGREAMPKGQALPIVIPPEAQQVQEA
jgi:hypothetical protein